MPLALKDRAIKSAYDKLPARTSNNLKDLLPLLATLCDKAGVTETDGLTLLKEAVSRTQQLALVKEGMSAAEKRDIGRILDDGTKQLTADARLFLEQLIGRTAVNPTDGPVQITAFAKKGQSKITLTGTAAKHVTVEAINLSTIPTKRLHDDNTFALGDTGADGTFKHDLEARAGDWLRMRTRDARGKESKWVMVRVEGAGADTRDAEVNLLRLELTPLAGGKVALANNNTSRPISEPYATLRFVNERTQVVTDLKLDDTGRFGEGVKLPGKAGDTFTVAATDGVNNTNLKSITGKVKVAGAGGGGALEDPLPHKDDRLPGGKSRYALDTFTGPITKNGAKPTDVMQGNIGDCYLPAAAASLAYARPGLFEQIVRKPTAADRRQVNADREARGEDKLPADATFYVVEFQMDRDGYYGKHLEAVDADFYVRSTGGPLYGASTNADGNTTMELWWPLFEKAYAQLVAGKDGYQKVGQGGSSADVFSAVLGRDWFEDEMKTSNVDACWRVINEKLRENLPVALGTYSDARNPGRFANSGIYGDHTYSVLGAFEKNGVKYLKLRNPWAESEPFPGDKKNDGVFDFKLSDCPKYFNTVWSVE